MTKLNAFAAEVDRDRTRFEAFGALVIEAANVAGKVERKLRPIRKWIDSIAGVMHEARALEDARPRLPPPDKRIQAPPKQIAPPSKLWAPEQPPKGGSDLDDESPFRFCRSLTKNLGNQPMTGPLESLPRRIFLDSCTAQTLRNYGGFIYEGEPISDSDRIRRVTDGIANVEALRNIFLINERALFEWIVSRGSMQEANDKGDPGHMQWLWDIADHSEICLEGDGPTTESEALAARIDEPKFGCLSEKDRLLLRHAIVLGCEAFLTMERRLPRNAPHIERELGIRILTPITHWEMLKPWAALWR